MSASPSTVPVEPARQAPSLTREQHHWSGRFTAMACPCEVLIENTTSSDARTIVDAVAASAWRIEERFSRYRDDNVLHLINTSEDRPVPVDEETTRLLDFASALTKLSEGRFDITSGVLRRAWTFDGSDRVPTQQQIEALLSHVGWHKVKWNREASELQLQPGMQIDFGGIRAGLQPAATVAVMSCGTAGVILTSSMPGRAGQCVMRPARSRSRSKPARKLAR